MISNNTSTLPGRNKFFFYSKHYLFQLGPSRTPSAKPTKKTHHARVQFLPFCREYRTLKNGIFQSAFKDGEAKNRTLHNEANSYSQYGASAVDYMGTNMEVILNITSLYIWKLRNRIDGCDRIRQLYCNSSFELLTSKVETKRYFYNGC